MTASQDEETLADEEDGRQSDADDIKEAIDVGILQSMNGFACT